MAQIILKKVGRGKVSKTIEVDTDITGYNEEELAVLAYAEVKRHLASSEVWLEPDEGKGLGHWEVRVGMGYHVGDVEIITK